MAKLAAFVATVLVSLIPLSAAAASDGPLRVDLASLRGFSSSQKEKVAQAADLMDRVFNSEAFRQAILDFEYDGKKQFAGVPAGTTNEQVYAQIMAGRETYTSTEDSVATLNLILYKPPFWKKWSVVGYTYPGNYPIHTNKYYFNSFTPAQVAGNLTHEWLHKIGFDHDYKRTARRPFSVPYAIGELMVRLAKTLQ